MIAATKIKVSLLGILFILLGPLGVVTVRSSDFRLPPIHTPKNNQVRQFKMVGNTVYSAATLLKLTDPYLNCELTPAIAGKLRHELTLFYVSKGYINSGAAIPGPPDKNGVVVIRIIEGQLNDIIITGLKRLSETYLKKRIASGAGPPLNIYALQEQIRILHENVLIRRMTAELKPGDHPGVALLYVNVKEARPCRLGFQFDNDRSPSVGGFQLQADTAYLNVTGWGDSLHVGLDFTQGLKEINAFYSIPITARDLTLNLKYKKNSAQVVEKPFDELDIASEAEDYGLSLSRPFIKTPGRELKLEIAAEKRHTMTSLLDRRFSFSPGVIDGEADVTVIRFAQEWLDLNSAQVLAVRSIFGIGINALNATQNPTGPDGEFFVWLGQIRWARHLENLWNSQLILCTDLQLSADPLLPMEKFSVGGADSVRGYRKNQLVKDNALVASAELRIPLGRVSIPGFSQGPEGQLIFAPFFDFGWAEDVEKRDTDPDAIYSLGAGLRWDPFPGLHAHVYYGYGFQSMENISRDLQDEGVCFQIRWDLF